jgi:hypothetical protein
VNDLPAQLLVIWRSPEFKGVVSVFVWLGSVNGGFWLLAKAAGFLVDLFSEFFWEEVWEALATVYNLVLAVFFAAILFVSATNGAPPTDLVWRQACGFVMLYVALSAAYQDPRTQELHDYAKPGFLLGLFSYILYAAFPKVVAHPELLTVIGLMKRLSDSWLGQATTALVVFGIVWKMFTGGLRGLFQFLAPFLYWVGLIKHPAIKIRRSVD